MNIQQAMNFIRQVQNPQQMLMSMGIPQEVTSNPQDVMFNIGRTVRPIHIMADKGLIYTGFSGKL